MQHSFHLLAFCPYHDPLRNCIPFFVFSLASHLIFAMLCIISPQLEFNHASPFQADWQQETDGINRYLVLLRVRRRFLTCPSVDQKRKEVRSPSIQNLISQ